ncbi:hypothetical protein CASFOL_020707 [Castilleja foliolosa]|uniref:AB hydrolase-1 domain-containing protein n=1 Tax=Castilleja foliolosa TaxID=1961234 RepID=A0ABD3D5E9_9LAMI
MVIITEEPEPSKPQLRKSKAKPKPQPQPTSPPSQPPPSAAAATTSPVNPFQFWFYSILIVSLTTLFFTILSYLSPQDPKTWFINLPPILRTHYSSGRTIKVQTAPNLPQIELFSVQQGPIDSDSRVLIVHGIGCSSFAFKNVITSLGNKNVHSVAIDLPGSGFSDKTLVVTEDNPGGSGVFGELWDVYEDIKEKGLFWGFDQLVEQGYVDPEENSKARASKKRDVEKPVEFGSEEMGKVLGQVIDSMGLSPVDLVLHDSAFSLSANWILENRASIRSLVVLDGGMSGTSFPLWVLGLPVVRELVLGSRFLFERIIVSGPEADAHRILLKGRDGVKAVVGMGKKLNSSFDLSEWGGRDEVKDLPVLVLWSGERAEEGKQAFAGALPMATFGTHSGGRWPKEDSAEEVAKSVYEFVSSLPKVAKPIPIHIEERIGGDHDHDHGHDGHYHAHAGYMDDAYGLGHEWGV